MKNNLWHFGDSFAYTRTKNFAQYIADEYNLNYFYLAESGSSNEQIFQKILTNLHKPKSGDLVIINFSYFTRYATLNTGGNIISTNKFFNDESFELTNEGVVFYKNNGTVLLDYFNMFNYEYNMKLFKSINLILEYLVNNGVDLYTIPIFKNNLNFGNKIIKPNNYGFKIKNELLFEPSYYEFLVNKNWKNEEDGHYTNDIQKELSNEYIIRIEKLKNNLI
jgi:hypothetical protein